MYVGKWLKVSCLEELRERAIFETASGGYIFSDDTGYFSVGDVREEGKINYRRKNRGAGGWSPS